MDILLTDLWRFFDPTLFGVVLVGVLTMAWIQNGRQSLLRAFSAIAANSAKTMQERGENATIICRRMDFIVREQGLSGLDGLRSQDGFVVRVANCLADAKDPRSFEEWVRLEQQSAENEQNIAASYWLSAAEIAPAIGLIGTITGLIQLFATGIDPMKMGPAMSFTLLTSLYGLLICHIIAYPIHVRLHSRAKELNRYRSKVVQHTIKIATGELTSTRLVHLVPTKTMTKTA